MFEYKSQANRSSRKSKMDTKSIYMGSSEALCFIVGTGDGSVFYINENAKITKYCKMESGIKSLLYSQDKSMLLVITVDLMLSQFFIKSDLDAKNLMTVKLNGRSGKESDFCWVGSSMLAYSSGESLIRLVSF